MDASINLKSEGKWAEDYVCQKELHVQNFAHIYDTVCSYFVGKNGFMCFLFLQEPTNKFDSLAQKKVCSGKRVQVCHHDLLLIMQIYKKSNTLHF